MIGLRQNPLVCQGHTRPVVDLAFSDITSAGYFLISASKDGKPMLRQGETGDWIGTFEGHKGAVWGATISSDAMRAATAAADFTAKVWNSCSGQELQSFSHKHIVRAVCFLNSDSRLLTGSNENCVKLFDLSRPDADPLMLSGHTGAVHRIVMQTEQRLFSAADDCTLRAWDLRTLQETAKLTFASTINSLQVSSDQHLLVATCGKSILMYEADQLQEVRNYSCETDVYSAAMDPSQQSIAFGGEDHRVYKYSMQTDAQVECSRGHFGPIHCVRYSPDGQLFATGSEDGTIRLWQQHIGQPYGLWLGVGATQPLSAPNELSTEASNDRSNDLRQAARSGKFCANSEQVCSTAIA